MTRTTRRLDLLDAGTPVTFGDGIPGYVTAVTVRGPYVSYEVAWFADGNRCEAWMAEHEIRPDDAKPALTIGFGG